MCYLCGNKSRELIKREETELTGIAKLHNLFVLRHRTKYKGYTKKDKGYWKLGIINNEKS